MRKPWRLFSFTWQMKFEWVYFGENNIHVDFRIIMMQESWDTDQDLSKAQAEVPVDRAIQENSTERNTLVGRSTAKSTDPRKTSKSLSSSRLPGRPDKKLTANRGRTSRPSGRPTQIKTRGLTAGRLPGRLTWAYQQYLNMFRILFSF